jgi:hypothetical protein
MARDDITAEQLRDVLGYDPSTGVFTWKKPSGHRAAVGTRAGNPGGRDSWLIGLFGRKYHARRLAWLYVHGEWPAGNVVPRNGDGTDARIENLREETAGATARRGKIRSTNTSGLKGVSWNSEKGKWIASFTRNYRRIFLGVFDTPGEAAAAYDAAVSSDVPADVGTLMPRHPSETRRQRWARYETIQRAPHLVGWDSLDAFLAEMGEPPDADHVLMRVRHSAPIGPGNATWRLPWKREENGTVAAKRNYHLGRFGLSDGDYKRMLAAQNGACAICRRAERQSQKGTLKQLCVDHDHATDQPRDLLCTACNAMLGLVGDDPWLLRTAADYLERHRALQADPAPDNVVPLTKKDSA